MKHRIAWAQFVESEIVGTEKWCRKEDSNLRPAHYECVALPTELFRLDCDEIFKSAIVYLVAIFFHQEKASAL